MKLSERYKIVYAKFWRQICNTKLHSLVDNENSNLEFEIMVLERALENAAVDAHKTPESYVRPLVDGIVGLGELYKS